MHKHLQRTLQNHPLLKAAKRIWVGFSGGVDSAVLLHALATEASLKNKLQALHIHHGLSKNADQWLKHCEQFCQDHGVAIQCEKVQLNQQGSVEQQARFARYKVFEQYVQHDDILVLGHHQDDQVETFMMRLMRGSGLTGLTAMDDERALKSGMLLRPLLEFSREQIEGYARQQQLNWIEDESNLDTSIDRNWWRQTQLPALTKRYPQARQSILKTLSVLQDEHALLNELLQPIYEEVLECINDQQHLDIEKLKSQSPNLQSQLIRMWQETTSHYPLLADKQISQLLKDFLDSREDAEPLFEWGDSEGCSKNQIRRYKNLLYIMTALPESRDYCYELDLSDPIEQHIDLPYGRLVVQADNSEQSVKPGQYQLVAYDGTLKAKPAKRPSKTLKKWFQEEQIPPWLRAHWPVLMHSGEVAAIPGLFVCEGYQNSDTGLLIQVKFE